MRRWWLLWVVLGAFALWFVVKPLPFLRAARPDVAFTPTVTPTEPSALAPVQVKGKGTRACLDQIEFSPDARFVQVTLVTKRPSPPIRVEARADGYRAGARIAPGLGDGQQVTVPIAPAPRDVGGGTLCFINEGRHQVGFYGINPGRGSSPSTLTIDGKPVQQELSVSLLRSQGASLGSRLGELSSRAAAFRPLSGWMVFLLGLLVVIGAPVAIGVALVRADEADAAAPAGDQPSTRS